MPTTDQVDLQYHTPIMGELHLQLLMREKEPIED